MPATRKRWARLSVRGGVCCALYSNSSAVIQARRGEEGGQQQVRFEGRGQGSEGEEQAGRQAGKTLPRLTTWGMHEVARRERWKIPLLSLFSSTGLC